MARVRIFTGHFGSGKTEFALNYAFKLAKTEEKVCLVDMDIVNPYFCSRDVREELEQSGIRLISSNPNLANAELTVISPEVMAVFNDDSYEVVIDVGGDDLGAVALGQFNAYFRKEPYDMYFVVNTNRPFTAHRSQIVDYIQTVERASRLKVTHLIANTNLSFETTMSDVLRGDELVSEMADELNLPHSFTGCPADLRKEAEGRVRAPLFELKLYMKTPWM
ncbi:hypothetical protein [Alicyclobacillus sp. SO9]|uniref:hypothetical protein n=1 Tax=Alicyclobacillus sp. SO9 TaxID=2665646 RepID=UPI0018E87A80|nr:hypothetical protein [Alicyclobacillus sp. SO9]QQE80121.1 hypothetical protein GI364_06710 [Alicyclobacillus sp. SO9]